MCWTIAWMRLHWSTVLSEKRETNTLLSKQVKLSCLSGVPHHAEQLQEHFLRIELHITVKTGMGFIIFW